MGDGLNVIVRPARFEYGTPLKRRRPVITLLVCVAPLADIGSMGDGLNVIVRPARFDYGTPKVHVSHHSPSFVQYLKKFDGQIS